MPTNHVLQCKIYVFHGTAGTVTHYHLWGSLFCFAEVKLPTQQFVPMPRAHGSEPCCIGLGFTVCTTCSALACCHRKGNNKKHKPVFCLRSWLLLHSQMWLFTCRKVFWGIPLLGEHVTCLWPITHSDCTLILQDIGILPFLWSLLLIYVLHDLGGRTNHTHLLARQNLQAKKCIH